MSFANALASLAALPVAGVAHQYDITNLPAQVPRGALPCLLVTPLTSRRARRYHQAGAFVSAAFSEGARTATCTASHLLLAAPAGALPARHSLPALASLIDAYLAALAEDPTLGGALAEPASVSLEADTFAWGSGRYYGCAFHHRWLLRLTP
jgi:hypothetical protein